MTKGDYQRATPLVNRAERLETIRDMLSIQWAYDYHRLADMEKCIKLIKETATNDEASDIFEQMLGAAQTYVLSELESTILELKQI